MDFGRKLKPHIQASDFEKFLKIFWIIETRLLPRLFRSSIPGQIPQVCHPVPLECLPQ
jgi:hypothetical protein